MQSVLYVSHGSRDPEAIAEARAFLTTVMQQIDVPLQEICFLEISSPSIEQGIETLAEQGATKIAVVPVLLLTGGHHLQDIPDAIKRAQKKHPDIRFTYGKPLGMQKRIVNVLAERIQEVEPKRYKDPKILLVGRGSRNPDTKEAIERTAKVLQKEINIPVTTCYLAVQKPSFDEALQSLSGKSNIIIVPYLWFTGLLMQYIQKRSKELSGNHAEIIVCRQLGSHAYMVEALKERVYEAIGKREAVLQWV